jgi:hypothetical protein
VNHSLLGHNKNASIRLYLRNVLASFRISSLVTKVFLLVYFFQFLTAIL